MAADAAYIYVNALVFGVPAETTDMIPTPASKSLDQMRLGLSSEWWGMEDGVSRCGLGLRVVFSTTGLDATS